MPLSLGPFNLPETPEDPDPVASPPVRSVPLVPVSATVLAPSGTPRHAQHQPKFRGSLYTRRTASGLSTSGGEHPGRRPIRKPDLTMLGRGRVGRLGSCERKDGALAKINPSRLHGPVLQRCITTVNIHSIFPITQAIWPTEKTPTFLVWWTNYPIVRQFPFCLCRTREALAGSMNSRLPGKED